MTMVGAAFSVPNVHLRIRTCEKIVEWKGINGEYVGSLQDAYTFLTKLLNRTVGQLTEEFNEDDARTCEILLGLNGYTVYRMLLIKRGLTESQITATSD